MPWIRQQTLDKVKEMVEDFGERQECSPSQIAIEKCEYKLKNLSSEITALNINYKKTCCLLDKLLRYLNLEEYEHHECGLRRKKKEK